MSERRSDYPVGYGKPPRHTRFRTGQSGNPRGRPKGSESLARLARRILNARILIRENGERRSITKLEAALTQRINQAVKGDAGAFRDVLTLAQHEDATDDKLVVKIVHFGKAEFEAASNER